jgi:predicted metal-dependent phosphoesterase TrpH
MQTIDLHAHTTASDGSLTPTELVVLAAEEGLTALGITDHDTVDGLAEAAEAARQMNIEMVPGIELSVAYPRGRFHLLGYLINYDNRALSERLRLLKENRANRNVRMVAKMQEIGLLVTLDEIREESGGGQVGRPHMAAALVKKGIVGSVQEAFDRYLGSDAPAYVPKDRITVPEGIELLHAAGGLAVLAHPDTLKLDDDALAVELARLRAMGLDGVECYYAQYTTERVDALLRLASGAGLLVTGGSDFHGEAKPEIRLGCVVEGRPAPTALLLAMKERKGELNRC